MVGEGLIEEFKIELGLKRCVWAKINPRMAKDIVAGGPSWKRTECVWGPRRSPVKAAHDMRGWGLWHWLKMEKYQKLPRLLQRPIRYVADVVRGECLWAECPVGRHVWVTKGRQWWGQAVWRQTLWVRVLSNGWVLQRWRYTHICNSHVLFLKWDVDTRELRNGVYVVSPWTWTGLVNSCNQ